MFRSVSVGILLCSLLSFASCKSKVQPVASKPLVAAFAPAVALEEKVVAKPDTNLLTPEERKILFLQKSGTHAYWRQEEAIHYDVRKPNFVIIHHTAQDSIGQTIKTFQIPRTKVSSHYVIGRNGEIIQMLNDYVRSWHAGVAKWGSIVDMNSCSIGIELDNNGREPFPEAQITSLMTVLDTLKSRYLIPTNNFIGHADIAPSRKNDPSVFFPWKKLAERGFGIWYDEGQLVAPPDGFSAIDALKIIGYDTSNLKAAIVAFKRKFVVRDTTPELTIYDKSVLYNIYKKY
ncbi:MAG: N-acetylmuramoyl-L-alanine amidase [Sphingobacterium sp.]|uniref:N-acetylmuramoyl-L-alanine amidase n=1 Tax=Sphingobacterium sp. TaxID=341027 RepID=UPI00284B3DCE|nr:N-acetylmuramoyl-L-alanine amidase [Sphingobacterium sp.]MDR3011276.1 N-acetylmuramoyl-L-alanine amidase [Sphingobacterium sp.]